MWKGRNGKQHNHPSVRIYCSSSRGIFSLSLFGCPLLSSPELLHDLLSSVETCEVRIREHTLLGNCTVFKACFLFVEIWKPESCLSDQTNTGASFFLSHPFDLFRELINFLWDLVFLLSDCWE